MQQRMTLLLALALALLLSTACQKQVATPEPPKPGPLKHQASMAPVEQKAAVILKQHEEKRLAEEAKRKEEEKRRRIAEEGALAEMEMPSIESGGEEGLGSVLVVGDSFAVGVGMSLAQMLKQKNITLHQKGKTSSGLNSPKFYNWEAKLKEFISAKKPDVLVAMISGNDAHNGSGSDSWASAYEGKVNNFLNIATANGVQVFMVGLPPMGKEGYSKRAKKANAVIERVCDNTDGCAYVDAWTLFSDDKGNYTRKKKLNGKTATLRAGDGVHFTMNGYKLLGRQILRQISQAFNLGL